MTHLVIWSTKLAFICVRLSVTRNNSDWAKLIVLISPLPLALPVCISFKFLCRSWWWWLVLVWSGLNLGKLSIKRTSMSRQRRHYIMSVCSHWLVFQVITWSEPFLPIGWSDQTITLHSSLDLFYQLHKTKIVKTNSFPQSTVLLKLRFRLQMFPKQRLLFLVRGFLDNENIDFLLPCYHPHINFNIL